LDMMHLEMNPKQKDQGRFLAEKTFEYKIVVEFPTKEEAGFLPASDAKVAMFWVQIENTSKRPMQLNTASFTLTDEEGRSYPALSGEQAFDRIISGKLGRQTFRANTSKGLHLGRSNAPTTEELKDETIRFTLQSGEIDAQG